MKITSKKKRRKEYLAYLASPEWKLLRLRVMARDSFQCMRCGYKRNLQVHHRTYANFGREDLKDLETLCKKCHKKISHK